MHETVKMLYYFGKTKVALQNIAWNIPNDCFKNVLTYFKQFSNFGFNGHNAV